MVNSSEKSNHEKLKGEIKFPFDHLEKIAKKHQLSDKELDELATKDKEARRETEAIWAEMEKKEPIKRNTTASKISGGDPDSEMTQYDKYRKKADAIHSSKIAHFNRHKLK